MTWTQLPPMDVPALGPMETITKTEQFGPVPISEDALNAFYLSALNELEDKYHKLPKFVDLELKYKTSTGENRFELAPFVLHATDVTTKEQRATTFAKIVSNMSNLGPFGGLSLTAHFDFKIEQ